MQGKTGLKIEPGANGPIYKQIVDKVSTLIREGVYPPGYRLPTTRELAQELGVHRNTVVRAFEEMASIGLVYTIVGSGSYVSENNPVNKPLPSPQRAPLPWNALASNVANAEPLTRFERLARFVGDGNFINLARMHPSSDLIPYELLRRCSDYVLRRLGADSLGYAPPKGLQKLRQLIARELWRIGVPANEDEVVVTTGSQQALDLIARVLLNPGDTVLLEEHSYPGAINAFSAAGARMLTVECDKQGPLIETLQQMVSNGGKALYLMPNCSNPTGKCITAQRRRELVEWSHRTSVPLIEDDYGSDLHESTAPVPLRALDAEVIYLGTFSKKLVPALRIGYVLCPRGLLGRITAMKQGMDLGTSLLQQHVLAEFIDRGYLRSHLRKIQPVYTARKHALAAALERHMPEDLEVQVPEMGVVFWINLPQQIDPEEVFQEALNQGVLVSPGSFHSVYPHAPAGLRLTYSGESEERLEEGARKLATACRKVLDRSMRRSISTKAPSIDGV